MLAFLLLLQAAAPAPAAPAWKLADRTSPAGVRSISASVTGNDGLSRFVVKCDVASEPIVSIQFIQPQPLGSGADKPVAVRFDGGPAFTYNWQFPGTGTYVTDPEAITKLTSFLVKSKTVRVETTNGASFAVQANFAAPASDAMVRQVLGVCGYTLGVVPPVPPKPAAEPAE
ncbi:hypothetical protein [Sphingomonas sp. Leaf38]|jgi:hypothetical protein|uniref:hypothetical protein n=1 Tax=Sphingomonas sp. Leaf38 TaxID=1736217 RepID=UPI0006F4E66A|nr:hypothetical protein [Sphingomonas sp. Leaf38]KQN35393.1 hypothetical protein ASE88_17635 [Sphingomonas sp. Leaf38]